MKIINSPSNAVIKDLLKLKKTGERRKRKLIMVDGRREIEMAINSGWTCLSLFYCPSLAKSMGGKKGQYLGLEESLLTEVSEAVFRKICYKESPDGYLAVIKAREFSLRDIKLGDKPLLVILDNIEKPGNIGAIMRSAAAAGVTAFIINNNQTDIFNPNVIRASEGLIFTQSVAIATISETVEWLRKNQIQSFAAATKKAQNYTKTNLSGRTAIVLGSEANGLSLDWLAAADKLIKIPMMAGIDSLNVSVAAAVILFEAVRQKSQPSEFDN